jgi:Uma2 family endonuclease
MVGASQQKYAALSVEAFRNWVVSRPDEERWELVDGTPMMMAPPTRDHQRIASNLERLLNDAIE